MDCWDEIEKSDRKWAKEMPEVVKYDKDISRELGMSGLSRQWKTRVRPMPD